MAVYGHYNLFNYIYASTYIYTVGYVFILLFLFQIKHMNLIYEFWKDAYLHFYIYFTFQLTFSNYKNFSLVLFNLEKGKHIFLIIRKKFIRVNLTQ